MCNKDIRWLQRFDNYRNALGRLTHAIDYLNCSTDLNGSERDLLMAGLVKTFELTWELSWKVMKDYAEYQGFQDIRGSRDAIRKAFSIGLITDERWIGSIAIRNMTSHDYDSDISSQVFDAVNTIYYSLFKDFERKMLSISEPELPLPCPTD